MCESGIKLTLTRGLGLRRTWNYAAVRVCSGKHLLVGK